MKLFRGNDLAKMVHDLAERIRRVPLACPLQPEWIVVQSPGVMRWLSLELARPQRLGVFGNASFIFPSDLEAALYRAAFPAAAEAPSAAAMVWRVLGALIELEGTSAFGPVRAYLERGVELDGGARLETYREHKRYQLARELAALFDRYQVYRPELLQRWEQQQAPEEWQAHVWRRVVQGQEETLPRVRWEELTTALVAGRPAGWPQRLTLFGLTTLTPRLLDVLRALDGVMDQVLLYQCVPGQVVIDTDPKDLTGLLASLGRRGAECARLISARCPGAEATSFMAEPASAGWLGRLQRELGGTATAADGAAVRLADALTDPTLQLHACHSPMREVETLHDALLELFDRDQSLMPEDVLVVAPSMEIYAPLIEAVFDGTTGEDIRLPYQIVDRSLRRESHMVEMLLRLLELPGGRLEASVVLGVLESAAVRSRLGIDAEGLDLIAEWVEAAGIRWGWDLEHKLACLGPEPTLAYDGMEAHSWRFGLDRLFLGYAMRGGDVLYEHGDVAIAPLDHVEGGGARALGALRQLLDDLNWMRAEFATAATLPAWVRRLEELVARLFAATDDTEWEQAALQEEFEALREAAGYLGEHDLSLEAVRGHLADRLEGRLRRRRHRNGGITFASLRQMRGVPFRVIGILAMNDRAFPASVTPLSFDDMAGKAEAGDPDVRAEDRLAFLEFIMLAGDVFYVSFLGRDQKDNTEMPPSVVVSELIDHLGGYLAQGNPERSPAALVRAHHLHRFHADYFQPAPTRGLYSYSVGHERAAAAAAKERVEPAGLFDEQRPLSAPRPDEGLHDISPRDLADYFKNPAKFLIRRRLGLTLPEVGEGIQDEEPFELAKGLEEWQRTHQALQDLLKGKDADWVRRRLVLSGQMVHGPACAKLLDAWLGVGASSGELQDFLKRFAAAGQEHDPLPNGRASGAALQVHPEVIRGVRISGTIEDVWEGRGIQRFRYSQIKYDPRTKDRLPLLIDVILLALQPDAVRERWGSGGRLVFKDAIVTCTVKDGDAARNALETLVGLYLDGLTAPLRFSPMASLQLAILGGREQEAAVKAFNEYWRDGKKVGRTARMDPESRDPYLLRAFAEDAPYRGTEIDSGFDEVAETVWKVLYAHEQIIDR